MSFINKIVKNHIFSHFLNAFLLLCSVQAAFVPWQQVAGCVRFLFNIVEAAQQRLFSCGSASFDARTLFDTSHWGCLVIALCQFGLLAEFVLWLQILCKSSLAFVITKCCMFSLQNSCTTRQRCFLLSAFQHRSQNSLTDSVFWH